MLTYRDYIEAIKARWIGKKVIYKGRVYTVIDVDYNGALLIDLPAEYTATTAVATWMIEEA